MKKHRTTGQVKRAVGYVRVSTTEQATDGVSLDAQKERVAAWCESNSYRLATVHVDAGLSGKRADNRPALQAALAEVCKAHGALVVYSLSRLARSTKDAISIAERLDKAGADLVSLTEQIDTSSASGKMVFRMLAVLAEFERDLVSERTTTALAHKAANGERVSRFAPFGFRFDDDGAVVPDEHEQEACQVIRRLRGEGLKLRQIGAALSEQGYHARNGEQLSATVILRVLHRQAEPSGA